MTGNGADPIDQAIAKTEQTERTVTMAEVPVQISSTGRPVVLHVPVDLSDSEIVELAGFVLLQMRPWINARIDPATAAAAGRLWTPP